MSKLLNELLQVRTSPDNAPAREAVAPTGAVELSDGGNTATADVPESGHWDESMRSKGLDPSEWEVVSHRDSTWETPDGQTLNATRYTAVRIRGEKAPLTDEDIESMVSILDMYRSAEKALPEGPLGYCVWLGDMQFGKEGTEKAVEYVIECLNQAAVKIAMLQSFGYRIGHIHIGWLGDHIEGFESQGGANAWRTSLTLTEQIRLTRRVMLHALGTFAPLAERVTMVAVPGNHGEAVRFNNKGVTRYDDSHDTEALVSVADAAQLSGKFEHVEFFVPDNDEMVVYSEVAGLGVIQYHGHQARPGKHIEWWREQAFHHNNFAHAKLAIHGHNHKMTMEQDGKKLSVGVPALEDRSQWWKNMHGSPGAPGILGMLVRNGDVISTDFIQPKREES